MRLRLFSDEFPSLILIGRNFAAFQKIPEGVVGINAGIRFVFVFVAGRGHDIRHP
jgi:hypothetical protein